MMRSNRVSVMGRSVGELDLGLLARHHEVGVDLDAVHDFGFELLDRHERADVAGVFARREGHQVVVRERHAGRGIARTPRGLDFGRGTGHQCGTSLRDPNAWDSVPRSMYSSSPPSGTPWV